ncbi:MAG: hypothetical protein IKB51_07205 [Clostridia bacterium]|nr:hypothetical protein [Clostridia bacterium]
MEILAKINYNEFYDVISRLEYENEEIIFSTKSKWLRVFFGVVGEALASYKESFRIKLSDIESITLGSSFTKKRVYVIKLFNGEFCSIVFKSQNEATINLMAILDKKVVV